VNRTESEAFRAWEAHRQHLTTWIKTNGTNPTGTRAERIARARKDYDFFVKTYFPHLAKSPSAAFHIEAANFIRRTPDACCAFKWPRGHAKSTHMGVFIPMWLLIQDSARPLVMLLVSKSEDAADRLLADLQAELQFNDIYQTDFNVRAKSDSWSQGEFKLKNGSFFMSLGRGQTPRGVKERGERPNYILIDDIDDDELVLNEKRVRKATEWCLSALFGTMDMGRGRFVIVGNVIAKTSILNLVAAQPDFHVTQVNALDSHGRPAWSENFTLDEIKKIRRRMGERMFQREYMNNPLTEGAIFQRRHLRYGPVLPLARYRSLVSYTDPSFKDSSKNDYKATALTGLTNDGSFHVIKMYCDQTSVKNMIGWHYDLSILCRDAAVHFYMESNFIQDLILEEFKKAGAEAGWQIPVRGDARKKPDKFARIEALQPYFERGLIIFNEKEKGHPGMMQLEEQLLMFERGSRAHDDAPDALEGAIYLLNGRHRTLNNTFAFRQRTSWRY
jgi:predicted phage terminase large subunit-like protein